MHENNWKRSIGWAEAIGAIGFPNLRVHDLGHPAASVWLGAGADPKVVQRVLGHASAAMTMDLYGHLIVQNPGRLRSASGAPGAFDRIPELRDDIRGIVRSVYR